MILNNRAFQDACRTVTRDGRPLEAALCIHQFAKPCPQLVLGELSKFQNDDGGFGHGIEPDFLLPDSSPLATSVALQLLVQLDQYPGSSSMIRSAIQYLELSYDPGSMGWYATPPTVNDHPHTPWWHFQVDQGMSEIDKNWGNPSAELIGYLAHYRQHVRRLDVDHLVNIAMGHLRRMTQYDDHEIYCYIRLHNLLPDSQAVTMRDAISGAVAEVLSHDPHGWEFDYQPRPMDFVGESDHRFGISDDLIELNLEYVVDKLTHDGVMRPSWGRRFYTDGLEDSWSQWQGILTLQALRFLDWHNWIDKTGGQGED